MYTGPNKPSCVCSIFLPAPFAVGFSADLAEGTLASAMGSYAAATAGAKQQQKWQWQQWKQLLRTGTCTG